MPTLKDSLIKILKKNPKPLLRYKYWNGGSFIGAYLSHTENSVVFTSLKPRKGDKSFWEVRHETNSISFSVLSSIELIDSIEAADIINRLLQHSKDVFEALMADNEKLALKTKKERSFCK